MQWVLQEFEDTAKLVEALERLELPYTLHKVVPFVGELIPPPEIHNPKAVVLFGAYSLWRYAEAHGLSPGVFRLRPFVEEAAWRPFLLNGPDARFMVVKDVPNEMANDARSWFVRPVDDSKELAGCVMSAGEIVVMAENVLALREDDIPMGSLRPDTLLMLSQPVGIFREWRLWAVAGRIVTYSLYKEGSRVVYRNEIDDDALSFAQRMVDMNPDYSSAYVIDICRTADGLKLLETNCINAAGFYAADLFKLAAAIDGLDC